MKYYSKIEFELSYLLIDMLINDSNDIYENGKLIYRPITNNKKAKLFREKVEKFYCDNFDIIPIEIKEKLSSEKEISQILDYLYENYAYVQEQKEKAKEENRLIINDFPDNQKITKIFESIEFEYGMSNEIDENSDLNLYKSESCSYSYGIILKNAKVSGDEINLEEIIMTELSRKNTGYSLEIIAYDGIVKIDFVSMEYYENIYNYSDIHFTSLMDNMNFQWNIIAEMLYSLGEIYELVGIENLSEKEQKLLPLVYFQPIVKYIELKEEGIDHFEEYLKKYNAEFMLNLTRKLREAYKNQQVRQSGHDNKVEKISRKIWNALIDKRCIKLFWALYRDLIEVAGIYERRSTLQEAESEEIRNEITEFFHKKGFDGEYPNFKKMDKLRGLKFFENIKYFNVVINEKHMVSMIKVFEDPIDIGNYVYLTGTVFLKENEVDLYDKLDAFDACFYDKSKSINKSICLDYNKIKEDNIQKPYINLANTAAKKAILEKLTIKEKKMDMSMKDSNIILFLLFLSVFSFVFTGTCFVVGFLIIEIISCLLFFWLSPDLWEIIKDTPWILVFFGSGLPIGGIFGFFTITTLFSKRKR